MVVWKNRIYLLGRIEENRMDKKKDEFKEWVVHTFDKEAEQELRRLQEKEDSFEVPEGAKEAVFARLQEQLKERNTSYQNEGKSKDIINSLSPDDRKALELGRKMMEAEGDADKNEKKKSRFHRKSARMYVALAAVIICVLAVGITSIGGPERVVRMVQQVVGDRIVDKTSNSDNKIKIIEDEKEEKAYQEIQQIFGTDPVKITWKPENMNFYDSKIDADNQIAELYYDYEDETVVYLINLSYSENSWGVDIEDEIYDEYEKQVNGCIITVREYKVDKKNKYTAKFTYKGIEYFFVATMDSGEFDKILNNLIFPK